MRNGCFGGHMTSEDILDLKFSVVLVGTVLSGTIPGAEEAHSLLIPRLNPITFK